jgi:hypothetical protein
MVVLIFQLKIIIILLSDTYGVYYYCALPIKIGNLLAIM